MRSLPNRGAISTSFQSGQNLPVFPQGFQLLLKALGSAKGMVIVEIGRPG